MIITERMKVYPISIENWKIRNMHNSAFRYKLDTNGESLKTLIYKA